MPRRLFLSAALLAVAAELAFASVGAVVKLASETVEHGTLVFYRNAFGLLVLLPLLFRYGAPSLRTRVLHLHLLRALAGLGAMYCFFFSLSHLALAEAMVLKMTAPLFVPVVAFLWLREGLTPRVATALAVGFAGVVLILRPDISGLTPAAAAALAGGILAALAKTTVRRLGRTEPGPRVVFYFAVLATAGSSLLLPFGSAPAGAREWGLLLAVGAFATTGQLLMTRAYALAEAPRVAPFTYASIVFGMVLGWLFWDEVLAPAVILGSLLVVAAGLMAALGRPPRPAAAPSAGKGIAHRPGEV